MAETSKPNYTHTWASGGDKQTLTQTIIQQGWTVAKPSFQRANAVESRQDLMLQHIDQHGIPTWGSDTEYFANKSWVTGSNGELYRAVADSVGVNPVGDTSNKWYRVLDEFFTKTQSDIRYLGLAVPSGAVFHFAMQTAPAGYLVCNGAAVSRTAFPVLFAAIGTLYGNGDGSTTFNLPDLRGEFLRGADLGRGIDNGRTFGSKQMGSLVGGYDDVGGSGSAGINLAPLPDKNSKSYSTDSFNPADYDITSILYGTLSEGGSYPSTSANNWFGVTRPTNIALLPCIKA